MNLEQELKKHFREDAINFKAIDDRFTLQEADHKRFDAKLDCISENLKNLAWLSDASRGISLLRRPALWLLAFVIGLVALKGGVRDIINWLIPDRL